MALALLAVSMVADAGQAQAQNVNWVLNLSDAGSDPTAAGGTITYTIDVENDGLDPAPTNTITLNVPATTTLDSTSGTITGCAPVPSAGPSTVTCTVPTLAAGASATLVADLRTTVSGSVDFLVSVAAVGDVDSADNALTEQTTVTSGADVALTLAGPLTASAGSVIPYTFTVTNNGPDPVSNKVVQFPIPTGITNVTAPAGCSLGAGVYNCTIAGPISVGGSSNLNFTGQISAAAGSTVTAIGSAVGGSPSDPISTNDDATLNTSVTGGSDLAIQKTRSPSGTILVGNTVTFNLVPTYTGDSPNGIVVQDTIPANYSISAVNAPGWTCSVTGQLVECLRTTGSGAGANVALGPISIVTTAVSAGSVTNTATISASGPVDPDLADNSDTDGGATILAPQVDLRANKSGPSPALVVVGNSYDFRISTSNVGNAPFFGTLEMTDTLPAGLEVTSFTTNGWSCSPAAPVTGPANILCTRVYTSGAPLAVGGTTPTVTLTTTATSAGSVVNGMSVASPDSNIAEVNLANNSTTYAVTGSTGPNSADVRLTKSATLVNVPAGEEQSFVIEVVNDGPQASTDVVLTDNLTGLINGNEGASGAGYVGTSFVANAATGLSCTSAATGGTSRRLTCTVASLPVCTEGVDCPVFTVTVRPGGNAGTRTNTADAISQTVPDANLANNSDSASFDVEARVDVAVSKADSPDPAVAGQNLVYVITAQNLANGLSTATGVTVSDTLPLDVTFVSASPSSGSCSTTPTANSTTSVGNRTVTCNLGSINNGAQQTVTITVRPNLVTRNTTLRNDASYSGTVTDINPANDTAFADTFVSPPTLDLIINKDDTVDPLPIGDDTVYVVTVTNLGPSAAENVVVTDTMPPNRITYQSHVATGATCATVPAVDSLGGTLECTFPTIPAGQSRTVEITGRGVAKGVATNAVTVKSDETDLLFETNTGNNSATELTTLRTRADLEVASKTATPGTVNLRDPFDFLIVVQNNAGIGLAEGDDVQVSDTLPAGMELTGTPTVSVVSGSASSTTCTGAAGSTSFTCALGTVSTGAQIEITVPARIVAVTSAGQSFTNTASVTTSSLDTVPGNNTNSGTVVANSSSLGGLVFRDFANDGSLTAGDTGISGVTMTLTGTTVDGAPISRTTTTDGTGGYTFTLLPEGTYSVSQGAFAEPHLTNGATAAGSEGGTVAPTQISAISLPPATAATDYIFPKVPLARVAIAKAVQVGPTINADGSYTTTFRLNVSNPSLEALQNMVVTDPLEGAAPLFGTYVAATPTVAGTYTVVSTGGSCGGINAGFTGAGDITLGTGFTLAASGTCVFDVQLRVMPTQPLPPLLAGGGRYLNQATITAEGALSGQTSATNPQLTDLSDSGTTPDSNGNGIGNEAGENDPTPVNPSYTPAITLTKAIDLSVLPSPISTGSPIGFTFTVTNSGNVTLTNVTLSDALPGAVVSGGPITLTPGQVDSATFTATYPLTAGDLSANTLSNTATAIGTYGLDATSTPQTVTDDDTVATDFADIALVKTANASGLSTPPQVGDIISYSFAVSNTGNVPLTNVTLSDILTGIVVSGGPIPSLAVGATDGSTFTATYALTQDDIDAGQVINRATATGVYGTDGGGNPVTVQDQSGATVAEDADTVVPLSQAPGIALVKSLASVVDTTGDGVIGAGDTANYAFAVTNTGNVALGSVTVTDPLVTVSGGPVNLAIGATNSSSFTAAYVMTQADVDAGFVQNTATTTGTAVSAGGTPILDGSGNPITVSDVSDTGTAPDGSAVATPATTETPDATGATDADPTNDPTVAMLAPTPRIDLIKRLIGVADTNGDGLRNAGDTATYGFTVTNTGSLTLVDVTVTDPIVTLAGGPIALLAVSASDSATYSATYVITQADVDRGYLDNSASVSGTAATVAGTPILDGSGNPIIVTDVSDAGTDPTGAALPAPLTVETPSGGGTTDGDLTNDPTVLSLAPDPQISLIKSLTSLTDTTGDSLIGAGDTATYTFEVTNTGNVALAGVTVSDPQVTVLGGPVDLAIGATDAGSFTGNYVLTQADVDRGYLENTATATGAAVTSTGVPIVDGAGNPVTASDVSDTGTAPDLTAIAVPEGTETPNGVGVTDADPTNDPTVTLLTPRPQIVLVKSLASVVDTTGDGVIGAGDTANYAFAVTNTGNVALGSVTVTDPLVTVSGGPVNLAIGATNNSSFTAAYVMTQADVDAGFVQNTATTTGTAVSAGGTPILDGSGNPITVSDVSDTGTAPDGSAVATPATTETPDATGATDADPTNDPTVAVLNQDPQITLIKRLTGSVDLNGSGTVDLGDTLTYAFEVTNTGNLALANVTVTDPLVSVSGGPVSLAVGATDSTTFTAQYTITAGDVTRTYIENSATAAGDAVTSTGTPVLDGSGNPVSVTDVSDTGTNPDGSAVTDPAGTETPNGTGGTDADPTNDPTVTFVGQPEIELDIEIADIVDSNGNGIIDAGDRVIYTFTVTNSGDVPLVDVDMDPASLTLPLPGLTCTPISLAVGETQTLVCTGNDYVITAADVAAGTVTLSGDATGLSLAGIVVADDDAVVSPVMGLGGLTITKTVDRSQVSQGDVVRYTVTVTNTSATLTTLTNVVDELPAGFVYQAGTATLNGVATEPSGTGRVLTWPNVSLAPGGTATVVLDVLVGGGARPGNHDNHARAVSPLTGRPVTPDAVATVRIAAEPVFDCATVIGRVFDDLNQDGYFNGEPKESRQTITDQTYRAGKWGAPEEPAREKGLPAVRLIAPNGLAITTDEHGRFSVPCAALPSDIGSNFMLKLDSRTLPSGYRLTTENPRVVRVTPGMITKMNFGATISRVVRIDLSGRAFGKGDQASAPRKELVSALETMVADIASTPTMLRLTYQLGPDESEKLARQRLRAVEKSLRKLWPANGRYQLNVETVIQRRASKTVNE